MAVVKVALRQRESLATLRVRDGVLVLNTMLWPDEIRSPEFGFLDDDIKLRPQEVKMAESLIDSMAGGFDPSQFKDDYREALQEVIEVKVGKRDQRSQAGGRGEARPDHRPHGGAARVGRAGTPEPFRRRNGLRDADKRRLPPRRPPPRKRPRRRPLRARRRRPDQLSKGRSTSTYC